MSVNVSIRTEEETLQALDKIAESLDRNRNWIINEAIKNYLELHEWQIEQVRQGFADAQADRTLSHEQVKNRILKRHGKATKSVK
jgi:predicted transcriptional regulator